MRPRPTGAGGAPGGGREQGEQQLELRQLEWRPPSRQQRRKSMDPEIDRHDRRRSEHHREKVVELEGAAARGVVGAVPDPQEAVHHVLVGEPGEAFHEDEGG